MTLTSFRPRTQFSTAMHPSPPKPATKKILIVEDNDLNLKLFRDLLSTHGFIIYETKDGLEALDMVRKYIPDLVIMDIQLQGVSGLDIIRRVKGDNTLKHIPIVAVTAFAMKDDKERILQSGCEDY